MLDYGISVVYKLMLDYGISVVYKLMLDYALGVGYQLMLDYVPIALDSWLAVLILYKKKSMPMFIK
jgi:hypothetical protein